MVFSSSCCWNHHNQSLGEMLHHKITESRCDSAAHSVFRHTNSVMLQFLKRCQPTNQLYLSLSERQKQDEIGSGGCEFWTVAG